MNKWMNEMFFVVSILLIIADQIFKIIVSSRIPYGSGIEVIPGFFELVYWKNTGAAWGIFSDGTFYLTIISAVASLVIIALIPKARSLFLKTSLSLILAGAVGNLIDRVRLGYVVDFLSFDIFGYDFPVFNLADMCIVIGCILMIIYVLFIHKENQPLFNNFVFIQKLKVRSKKSSEEEDAGVQ
jgi:signal peptidase II